MTDPPASDLKNMQPQDKGPPTLPRSLHEANLSLVNLIKEETRSRVDGLPGKPHTINGMTDTTLQLPELRKRPPDFQRMVKEALFDQDMKETLKQAKALNWCRTIRPLYPLRTMGDGNCLLHAVSLAMWGIEDTSMLLRRLVYIALVEDEEQCEIKKRWHKDRRRLNEAQPDFMLQLNTREWEQEWEMVVKAAEDLRRDNNASEEPNYGDLQYECLEEIHIFVLANVLKRPIIVIGDSVIRGITGSSLAPNNFRGTYLPLLWKPDECIKTPIVLAFCNNHFAPLVSFKDSEDLADNACPLVTSDLEPFNVHFLLPHEESVVNRILQSYLNITELAYTRPDGLAMILAATLTYTPIPERLDLMRHYMYLAERQYREYVKYKSGSARDPSSTLAKTPISPHKEVNKKGLGDLHLSLPASEENNKEVVRTEPLDSTTITLGTSALSLEVNSDRRQANVCNTCGSGQANSRYGGQCSQCYGSMVGEHEKEDTRPPAPPTAPNQSLVTNVTPPSSVLNNYSWRQERPVTSMADPVPDPMIEGMSMINQLCAYPKCRNLSSVSTFPYCHTHAVHKSRRPHSNPRITGQTMTMQHITKTQRETERHSFDESSFHQSGHPCVEPGCDMYGLPKWDNRCSQHRAKANGKTTIPKAMESWQPCRNTGCKNHGNARYTGYCPTCFNFHKSPTKHGKATNAHEPLSASPSSSTVSSSTSFERMQVDPKTCIGPNCSNPGLDTYNGLCQDCYTLILQQKTASQGPGVPRRKIRVSSADYEEEVNPSATFCISRGCTMFGTPEHLGYCSQCWKAQKHPGKGNIQIGQGLTRVVQQPNVEYRVTTGVPVPVANQCRTPRCPSLAEAAFAGYCRPCYNLNAAAAAAATQPKSYSAPIPTYDRQEPTPNPDRYTSAVQRLETSLRSSVRQCKTSGCMNFGNPKAQGYCNDCFKQRQDMSCLHHSTGGHCCRRYPRGSGWDECDNDGGSN